MSLLDPSKLEDHSTGTINKNGIINGNWRKLNALLDPDLSPTDPTYGTLFGLLERAVRGQRGATSLTYAATVEVKLADGSALQKLSLAGNVTIDLDQLAAGRSTVLIIIGDGSTRTVTWDGSHKWASAAITSIAAGKVARIQIDCLDDTNAGVVLTGSVTP